MYKRNGKKYRSREAEISGAYLKVKSWHVSGYNEKNYTFLSRFELMNLLVLTTAVVAAGLWNCLGSVKVLRDVSTTFRKLIGLLSRDPSFQAKRIV
jgi:hypothetical protein